MSIQEGRGRVPPKPELVHINRGELEWLKEEADKRNAYRDYDRRSDVWGKGVVSNPTLTGMVGEFAFCRWFNGALSANPPLEIDTSKREYGDGGVDFRPYGVSVQVKTREKYYGRMLIRREKGSGELLEFSWAACVQATWCPGDLVVGMDGWSRREWVLRHGRFETARKGDWKNIVVEDADLVPMRDLAIKLATFRDYR